MKAILTKSYGSADELYFDTVPLPSLEPEQVLIKVCAAGINRMDIYQREGKYPLPPSFPKILGVEVAGVIEKMGSKAHRFKVGDSVMCLLDGGGYAEYVAAQEGQVMPIPSVLSYEEAAAIPEVFLTAYQALFWLSSLKAQQTVLIHAAAGGVGTAAIQLVKEKKAESFITAGSDEKVLFCKNLGASYGCNYKTQNLLQEMLKATQNRGFDTILDFFGARFFSENIALLAKEGTLVLLSAMGGNTIEQIDLALIMKKWITIKGSTLRVRPLNYKAKLIDEFCHFALERFENKSLRPIVDKVFPWAEVKEAHRYLESQNHIGKIVLRL